MGQLWQRSLDGGEQVRAIILCGGKGTRLQSKNGPKPLAMVGGIPLVRHVMNTYEDGGVSKFLLCTGYRGVAISEYVYHATEDAYCLYTGEDAMTGGRVRMALDSLSPQTVCVAYSDCLCNVNIQALLAFHKSHGRLATVTAVLTPLRWGNLSLVGKQVSAFNEKSTRDWISAGYFVFEPGVIDYLPSNQYNVLEQETMRSLAKDGQLMAYQHEGFFLGVDTPEDLKHANQLWAAGNPPWRAKQ